MSNPRPNRAPEVDTDLIPFGARIGEAVKFARFHAAIELPGLQGKTFLDAKKDKVNMESGITGVVVQYGALRFVVPHANMKFYIFAD